MKKTIIETIPCSEDGSGVVCNGKFVYIISQNLKKEKFTLWKKIENGYERIAVADNPVKLYDEVEWF